MALLACGGEASSSPQLEPPGPVVTTILVTAPAGPLQVGATLALVAEVRDQTGATITGKTLAWSSANTAVATVSSAGSSRARGPARRPSARSVDGKTGSTAVTVALAPVCRRGDLAAGRDPRWPGATPLTVVVSDRNGTALLGRRITWSSSAPLVGDGGREWAAERTEPRRHDGHGVERGSVGIARRDVSAPEGSVAPTIASISPATLAPGATATISGTGFLGAANTAVTVAGVAAAVVATTASEITIAVPAAGLPCQSTQPVPVTVATVGGMATTSHPLAVARARHPGGR